MLLNDQSVSVCETLTMLRLPLGRGVCTKRDDLLPVPKMADTSGFLSALLGVTVYKNTLDKTQFHFKRIPLFLYNAQFSYTRV